MAWVVYFVLGSITRKCGITKDLCMNVHRHSDRVFRAKIR